MCSGIHALFVIPAARISSKFGFKHSILYSIPFAIVFYLMLYTIEIYNWPLYGLALIVGVHRALFWMGYHTDFSKFSKRKSRGKEIGIARMLNALFAVLGPVAGGLILTVFGFKILFVIVSLLLFASAVPLFFSKDIHEPVDFSLKQIFTDQKAKDGFAFAFYGIEGIAAGIIWPIFIFFTILNSYTALGLVATFSLFFSLIFTFVIARYSDVHRRLALKIGVLAHAFVWGAKLFVTNAFQVYIADSFHGITRTFKGIPFEALSYDKANKSKSMVEFIVFREIFINVGAAVFAFLIALSFNYTTSFMVGGLATLLQLLF